MYVPLPPLPSIADAPGPATATTTHLQAQLDVLRERIEITNDRSPHMQPG